jgi:hypothetical protein
MYRRASRNSRRYLLSRYLYRYLPAGRRGAYLMAESKKLNKRTIEALKPKDRPYSVTDGEGSASSSTRRTPMAGSAPSAGSPKSP